MADVKLIPLSNSEQFAIVDACFFDEASKWTWYLHTDGYPARRKSLNDGSRTSWLQKMHREVVGLNRGDPFVVDHINGNRLDNRKENLRICTRQENLFNARIKKSSKTGFKGVQRTANCKDRWTAYVVFNGNRYCKSGFASKEDAYMEACKMREELHGEFANHG